MSEYSSYFSGSIKSSAFPMAMNISSLTRLGMPYFSINSVTDSSSDGGGSGKGSDSDSDSGGYRKVAIMVVVVLIMVVTAP